MKPNETVDQKSKTDQNKQIENRTTTSSEWCILYLITTKHPYFQDFDLVQKKDTASLLRVSST